MAAPFTIGAVYSAQGRLFRFVQNSTDAAIVNGAVLVWASSTNYVVTGTARATSLVGALAAGACAGVGIGTIDVSKYGFVLVLGLHTSVLFVATVTVGRLQRASATADSGQDVANAHDSSFGTCLTTGSGGRYPVQVRCL